MSVVAVNKSFEPERMLEDSGINRINDLIPDEDRATALRNLASIAKRQLLSSLQIDAALYILVPGLGRNGQSCGRYYQAYPVGT